MTARLEGVAVVFVNHHSESLLAPKLPPLLGTGAEVVVVDNSGTFPGSSGVKVIDPKANVGFGWACNLALDRLGSACITVCFQNPDLDAVPEVLERLHRRVQHQIRPGVVTPAMRVGGVVRRNGYHYPSPSREILVGLQAIAALRARGGVQRDGRWRAISRLPARFSDVVGRGRRFGSGGLMVASREALTAVGGFDEDYFLYAEDLDLWHRVGQHGYVTEIDPTVVVDHDEATGGRMAATDREILRWLGVELFAERTEGVSWSTFRHVHRSLMPMLDRGDATIGESVRRAWDRGAPPLEVQREVRSRLAGRTAIST